MTPPRSLPALGLCCSFLELPIRFRIITAKTLLPLTPVERTVRLREVALDNVAALRQAVESCHRLGIGAYRIPSSLFPRASHPEVGYVLADIEHAHDLTEELLAIGDTARSLGVRLSFHPDQFNVLNSEKPDTVAATVRELDRQGEWAALLGASALCLHAGSTAGGADAALARLEAGLARLGTDARSRLAFENDDRLWRPAELLPFCERVGLPMVYDVHHHRCAPDGLDVAEVTARTVATWNGRVPWFHLSSPRDGWNARDPRPHHDYIQPGDWPPEWDGLDATVDVEAKAKERAVLALAGHLRERRAALSAARSP